MITFERSHLTLAANILGKTKLCCQSASRFRNVITIDESKNKDASSEQHNGFCCRSQGRAQKGGGGMTSGVLLSSGLLLIAWLLVNRGCLPALKCQGGI